MKIEKLKEWLYLEITERRDYTASKAYEQVLLKIKELEIKKDKCICKSIEQLDNCTRNCGRMGY